MKLLKSLSAMAVSMALLLVSMPARAQDIPYTATYQGTTSAALGELRDNIYPALIGVGNNPNGFHPGVATGTITFTFASNWNPSVFRIWNNINTTIGGVREFRLTFYDGNNNVQGTVQRTIVNTQANAQSFNLAALVGVRRVEMEVISSYDDLIEIREIRFDGTPTPVPPTISTCCPVSATFALPTMFNSVQGNVTGNYHLNFTMNPTFDAQMAAYAALLKALDPSITSTFMVVRAYNGGSGTAAAISGAPLQVGAVFWGPPPGSSGNLWPLSAFFTTAADLPTGTWTVVEVTVWVNRDRMLAVQLCETRRFSFRPQIAGRARSSASGFVDYTGPAPRTAPPPPAAPPRR